MIAPNFTERFEPRILVGDQAADQRRQVNQRGIAAVEAGRLLVLEEEMLGQIERQQRPHAVIAEPLPHLGGEQPRELARMAEPCALVGGIDVPDAGENGSSTAGVSTINSLPRVAARP